MDAFWRIVNDSMESRESYYWKIVLQAFLMGIYLKNIYKILFHHKMYENLNFSLF